MKKNNLILWFISSFIATTIFFSQVFIIPAQTVPNADLFHAIKRRSLALVKKIAAAKYRLELKNNQRMTPLMDAASQGLSQAYLIPCGW